MGMINRTDKLDARGLNRLQRAGTLPAVWIPPSAFGDWRDLPRTRMVLKDQALGIAPVGAALGHDPVHRDTPALRLDGLHPGQLVADADGDGFSRQARQGSVEETGPTAESVAGFIPSDHRQQRGGGNDGIGAHRMGDAERAGAEGHAGMPFAEDERCPDPTTAGTAVSAPRSRSLCARRRASYSPRIGQQKASFTAARPGSERSRWASMRWPKGLSVAASRLSRAAISRARPAFLQDCTPSALMLP